MTPSEQESQDIQVLSTAFDTINTTTTLCGTAATTIKKNQDDLLAQIKANAGNAAAVHALVEKASTNVGQLGDLSTSLNAIANPDAGATPANPVPVPVPVVVPGGEPTGTGG